MAAETLPIPKDPIQTRSMSVPIFLATAALVGSFFLAMYDEFFMRRPYKKYQENFVVAYANYLEHGLLPKQEEQLAAIVEMPEYKAFQDAIAQATKEAGAAALKIDEELRPAIESMDRIADTVKVARAKFQALTYRYETAENEAAKAQIWDEMQAVEKGPYSITIVNAKGEDESLSLSYDDLLAKMAELRNAKAEGEKKKGQVLLPAKELQKEAQRFVETKLSGPHPENVKKLLEATEARKVGPAKEPMGLKLGALPNGQVLQINVDELNWVDRCESCHVGTREPVTMTAKDLAAIPENNLTEEQAVVFTSHPKKALLDVHDPEKFGCSMCHGGNGRSVSNVELAHGKNKHWIWPLHDRENTEAGCQQCHRQDIVLKSKGIEAPTLNQGKWLFYWKGCWGCHKYEGIDREADQITALTKQHDAMLAEHEQLEREKAAAEDNDTKGKLDQRMSGLETQRKEVEKGIAALQTSQSKVGPSLVNIRAKANRDWLPKWIENPKAFRPTTKMPQFRFEEGDVAKIAAYLWQNHGDQKPAKHQPGDVTRGQWLFEQRGCLACHTVTRGNELFGDGFATNLTRIGDKANYDFTVEWILNPTNGVMPNLRLTEEDARHIASYLFSLKSGEVFPPAPELDDPNTVKVTKANPKPEDLDGAALIRHYGCAGCHEIKGMETESRIGTELTYEGSKPKERLDFGRLEHDYKKEGRYTHKDFFMTKLENPATFGKDKYYKNPREKLKMPNFGLNGEEINALTTYLIGSVESELPKIEKNTFEEAFAYNPKGAQKAIQEGWWIAKKYNCVGCHQFETGTTPHLWTMPMYNGAGDNGKGTQIQDLAVRRPPSLVGQGFRTDPVWLAKFLRNPSLTLDPADQHRNGARTYLDIRMPTFRLSDIEIQKLVAFFGALSNQPAQYQKAEPAPLNDQELPIARALVKGIQCINCHAIGDPKWDDVKANAPRLTLMGERMNPPWTRRWIENPKLLMPGTAMPQNFAEEWQADMKNGQSVRGSSLAMNKATGEGTLKNEAGETVKFKVADLAKPLVKTGRWVATDIPEAARGYMGDHIDLVVRYLHRHYNNAAEIQATLPGQ